MLGRGGHILYLHPPTHPPTIPRFLQSCGASAISCVLLPASALPRRPWLAVTRDCSCWDRSSPSLPPAISVQVRGTGSFFHPCFPREHLPMLFITTWSSRACMAAAASGLVPQQRRVFCLVPLTSMWPHFHVLSLLFLTYPFISTDSILAIVNTHAAFVGCKKPSPLPSPLPNGSQ